MSFLQFTQTHDTGKTKAFDVHSIRGGERLAIIKWYAPWRRYVFMPEDLMLFDTACLTEIVKYIESLMIERKRQTVK